MHKVKVSCLWLAEVLLCGSVIASGLPHGLAAAPRTRLLETGEFHGDEVRARTGAQWLGLYASRGRSALLTSTLRIRRVHDPIVDEQPDEKTGKQVSVSRHPAPIFLVRGAPMLRPGPVTTIFAGSRELKNQSDIRLRLGKTVYHLRVVTRGPAGDEISEARDNVRLVLASGASRQVLYTLPARRNQLEAGEWNLFWAGDLDHDGRLDLYVEVSDNYNASQRKLFLSSPARRGRLVREIAEFETEGC